MKKSIILMGIVLMLLIGNVVISVVADTPEDNNVEETVDLDISKSLETTENNHQYNIVFNLPTQALEEPIDIDIVFVMDTTSIENYSNVRNEINKFLERTLENSAVRLNIGVVKFALDVNATTSSLTTLTNSSISSIKGYFSGSYTAGSNMYGGLLKGQQLLDTGNAEVNNKYLIMASDFGGYKSDTGDGKGRSFFFSDISFNQGVTGTTNNSDFHARYYSMNTREKAQEYFTVEKVDNLIKNKTFFNNVSVTDETDKYLTQTGPLVSEFPDNWTNPYSNYGIISHTWTQEEKSTLIPNYGFINRAQFPTSMEKSMYLSGLKFLEMKEEGYNVLAVTSPYQYAVSEMYKFKFNEATNAYKDWFEINVGKRYEITKNETFTDLLDDIEADITYLVGKGKIVDVVDPSFHVISGNETILLNGEPLQKTELNDGSIGFGTVEDGLYPYVYKYNLINDEEIITWEINKEARKEDVLQFKFGIELIDIPNEYGVHTLDTNTHAYIDYLSSKEINEGQVAYTKRQYMPSPSIDITIGKVIARYIDEKGNELSGSMITTGEENTSYTTSEKMFEGYELLNIDGNEEGLYTPDEIIVTYVYKKIIIPEKIGTVIINYVDENYNELLPSLTITGKVGTLYSTILKNIKGYQLLRVEGFTIGNFMDGIVNVTYIYKQDNPSIQTGKVIVKYVDKDGKEIEEPIIMSDKIGEAYKTSIKQIKGYKFIEVKGQEIGTYQTEDQIVTYIYEKIVEEKNTIPQLGLSNNVTIMISVSLIIIGTFIILKKEHD